MGLYDEISNLLFCGKLLDEMGIFYGMFDEFGWWVKYIYDWLFNDYRYVVDGMKLR